MKIEISWDMLKELNQIAETQFQDAETFRFSVPVPVEQNRFQEMIIHKDPARS